MIKKILLIGGSSKVGFSIINKLKEKNYEIHSTFNTKEKYKKVRSVKEYRLNLSSDDDQKKFLKKISYNFDTIIFLSGILKSKKLKKFSSKEIFENMSINFTSQITLLNLILKKQKRFCLTIFLSSISGQRGSFDPVYASAKGAMISFVKSMSKWTAPKFRFIGLCPGLIENTKMHKSFKKNRLKKLLKENPNKEFLNTEDLADIIIDITKPHWRHANGSIIDINGGTF